MRLRPRRLLGAAAALALMAASALPTVAATPARLRLANPLPHYNHFFVIMMENHSYSEIFKNPYAPHINQLATQYGYASHYYGVTHPSEPNYVAILGGDYFGIQNDAPYTQNVVTATSLADQLEAAGLTWKSYQQSLPTAGYTGTVYPDSSNALYASKHNGFLNFADIQSNPSELAKIVPDTQLIADLQSNSTPNFAFIAPDQCHDMHGGPPACPYSNAPGDANDNLLIQLGDNYVNDTVNAITSAPVWTTGGNVAIVVVWDEDDHSTTGVTGCCDANPGGGQVLAVVITNHGPHNGLNYTTPANHYSMLRTFELLSGLTCLQHACDRSVLKSLAPLFAVS